MKNFETILLKCEEIFYSKLAAYGESYKELTPTSLVDVLYSKSSRIKFLSTADCARVDETLEETLQSIINYSIIYLIQSNSSDYSIEIENLLALYKAKNHDYQQSWMKMLKSTFVDLIAVKVQRLKSICASSAVEASAIKNELADIINYSVFLIIKLSTPTIAESLAAGDVDFVKPRAAVTTPRGVVFSKYPVDGFLAQCEYVFHKVEGNTIHIKPLIFKGGTPSKVKILSPNKDRDFLSIKMAFPISLTKKMEGPYAVIHHQDGITLKKIKPQPDLITVLDCGYIRTTNKSFCGSIKNYMYIYLVQLDNEIRLYFEKPRGITAVKKRVCNYLHLSNQIRVTLSTDFAGEYVCTYTPEYINLKKYTHSYA